MPGMSMFSEVQVLYGPGKKTFLGRLTRYADAFVIQCATKEQAERALEGAREQLHSLKRGLHPEKTQLVRRVQRAGEGRVQSRVRENLTHGSQRGRRKHDLPNPW